MNGVVHTLVEGVGGQEDGGVKVSSRKFTRKTDLADAGSMLKTRRAVYGCYFLFIPVLLVRNFALNGEKELRRRMLLSTARKGRILQRAIHGDQGPRLEHAVGRRIASAFCISCRLLRK